jgi:hypothetical protein
MKKGVAIFFLKKVFIYLFFKIVFVKKNLKFMGVFLSYWEIFGVIFIFLLSLGALSSFWKFGLWTDN